MQFGAAMKAMLWAIWFRAWEGSTEAFPRRAHPPGRRDPC